MSDELAFIREERGDYSLERAETAQAVARISSPLADASTPHEGQWFWEVAWKGAGPDGVLNGYAATRDLAMAATMSSLRTLAAGGRRGH